MTTGSLIFSILWAIILPIAVFLNIFVTQIRLLDTFVFKLLKEKDLRLAKCFALLKLIIFTITFLLFLWESLRFYHDIYISNSQAFFLSLILVVPIQLLFIYNVSVYVYNIYTRGYVFMDEIFKLIVLLLLTCILNMFSNELNFLPGNQLFTDQREHPTHQSDNKRKSNTSKRPTSDIKVSSPKEKSEAWEEDKKPTLASNLNKAVGNAVHQCVNRLINEGKEPDDFPFPVSFPSDITAISELHPPEFLRSSACGFISTVCEIAKIKTDTYQPYDQVPTPSSPNSPFNGPGNFQDN